jgi:dihydroorotate dehydrogenase (NAD+) catalytic subunit
MTTIETEGIELAPHHKVGLALANPVMPAAGCFGLGTEYARLVEIEVLGAVLVGPITARPRRGAEPPRTLPVPGGVLLHTGLANPGVAAVTRRYARAWARSPVPVIVHVAGTTPEETASCCRRLSGVAAVAGVELGLPDRVDVSTAPAGRPPGAEPRPHTHPHHGGDGPGRGLAAAIDDATALISAAHGATSQPLIVRLPLVWADALCEPAVEAGADALTVAAPPRGTGWHGASGRFVTGRLYGPFVLGLALRALRRVAERVSVPLIGCGGIHTVQDAATVLRAGAAAVQVGGALWRDPTSLARIARGLSSAIDPR